MEDLADLSLALLQACPVAEATGAVPGDHADQSLALQFCRVTDAPGVFLEDLADLSLAELFFPDTDATGAADRSTPSTVFQSMPREDPRLLDGSAGNVRGVTGLSSSNVLCQEGFGARASRPASVVAPSDRA